jgi:hypothetical protein
MVAAFGVLSGIIGDIEAHFELENFPFTHLLAWLHTLERLSEIQMCCIESGI